MTMRTLVNFLSRRSLATQLLTSLVGNGLVPLALLLAVMVPVTRSVTEQRIGEDFSQRARLLAVGVGQLLDDAVREVQQLADDPVVVEGLLDPGNASEAAMLRLHRFANDSRGRFLSLWLVDASGRPVLEVDRSSSQPSGPGSARIPAPPLDEDHFAIGEISAADAAGNRMLPLSAPVHDWDGRCIGRLIAAHDAVPLAEQALTMRAEASGSAALVTRSGQIFAAGELAESEAVSERLRRIVESGRPAVMFDQLCANRDVERLIVVHPVPSPAALGATAAQEPPLAILVSAPRALVRARASDLLSKLFGSGLLLLCFLALGSVILAGRISRPLRQLARRVESWKMRRRQESGEPDELAPNGTNNEVHLLQVAFATMTRRVEQHQRRLEQANEKLRGAVEQLRDAEQIRDEFNLFLSHELRTPLMSIRSFAEVLRITPDVSPSERMEFLQIIEAECERLTRLSEDLLDVTMIKSGNMVWRDEPVEVGEVLNLCRQTASVLAERQGVHVLLQRDPELPHLQADRDRLTQLLTNLLSNALKFTPAGGQVTLRASAVREDGRQLLRMVVLNTGEGIPEDHLERIFDRFVQAPEQKRDGPRGTGLGLAICQLIVQHYGGTIRAENLPAGGASFIVRLPVQQTSLEPAPEPTPELVAAG